MSVSTYKTDLLGFIKDELSRRRGEWREISTTAKVPYFTLSKISNGTTKDPRISSVQALANYFHEHPKAA
ncbi:hypothetical protein ACA087_00635 [Pseudomonas chlororaphis]|uniref:hypothetical protein n=1 Tax=Pseudomonas chlororaphis TaxID=587753 RepID=UPI00352B65A7